MKRIFLAGLHRRVIDRPGPVLAIAAAMVVAALWLGAGVELRSSRSDLAGDDDPDQARWQALLADYAGSESVIVCVETAPGVEGYVDALAGRLARAPGVGSVFHRIAPDWIEAHLFHLVPADQLAALAEMLDAFATVDGIAALDRALAERLEGALTGGGFDAEAAERAGMLESYLRWHVDWLEAPAEASRPLVEAERPLDLIAGRLPGGDGRLRTRDGSLYYLLVSPEEAETTLPARRRLVAAVREAIGESEFRVALTGQPAIVVEEMATIRGDTLFTSVVAAIGVTLLTLLVFRRRRHALYVLAALGCGVLWAFGAVRLELGYLNTITTSFISTLIGVGVAYGIHPVSEYELLASRGGDVRANLRRAFGRTADAVTVGAVTTSAAFFSILLMRFRGFAELGLVAGVGVLLCWLAAIVLLPALLSARLGRVEAAPLDVRHSVLDRLWSEAVTRRLCAFPRLTVALAFAVTLLLGYQALRITVDTDILELLPADAESVAFQKRLAATSDVTPLFNLVRAGDLAELRALARAAADEPAIASFQSVLRLLPAERDPVAFDALRNALARVEPVAAGSDRETLVAALDRLEIALADAADAAFTAGVGDAAVVLESTRELAERARDLAAAADAHEVARWQQSERDLAAAAARLLERLELAAANDPPTLATLPAAFRERFTTRSGELLGLLLPGGDLFDPPTLESFVEASRRVSAEVTGFPVLFRTMSQRIVGGFGTAVAVGAVLVLAILLIDFRSPRDALLAATPLAMGAIWMMGAMRLFGIDFNFANLVGVPLIIGVGIDNGVHVMRRVQLEGERGIAVVIRHTGRAIVIASLTTMIGFGSLGLAAHRGMASLGIELFVGVGACLISSTVILPNLLLAVGRVRA